MVWQKSFLSEDKLTCSESLFCPLMEQDGQVFGDRAATYPRDLEEHRISFRGRK